MEKKVELAIIGAGIAGIAAAIYAKRIGLEFLIFEAKGLGGQLLLTENIDNYVGLRLGTKGRDLAKNLAKSLDDLGIVITNSEILKVTVQGDKVILGSSQCIYSVNSLIIATGATFAKLGVAGEDNFLGRGVSYCAVCDGFFFKGKDVIVVGGGNTAVEEALYLAEIANKVTLINRRDKLRAVDYLQKKLFSQKNIEPIFNSVIKEVKGSEFLEGMVIENVKDKQQHSIAASGLFIAIGINPNTGFLNNIISLDQKGFIITDETMQSSSRLIWACGDCRRRPLKQLITAAAEGAIAAVGAYKHNRGHYISS